MKINKDIKVLKNNIEEHLDDLIEKAVKENKNIKEISERINGILNYWKSQDVWNSLKITGYSQGSLYEKIGGRRPIKRKKRNDNGEIRNPILKIYWEEIEDCAPLLYSENKQPSLNILWGFIVKKLDQENGELAKVPYNTYSRHLRKLLEKSNQENKEKVTDSILKTEQKIYFAGWNTKKEIAKFIMIANQESDNKKKAEKFLTLIKIKV
jgi:hypothetical protein